MTTSRSDSPTANQPPELPAAFFEQLLGLRPVDASQEPKYTTEEEDQIKRRQVRIESCGKDGCNGMYTDKTPHNTCFKCKKGFCEPCSSDGEWLVRHSTQFIQTRDDIAIEAHMQLQRDYNHEKNKVRANLEGRPYPSRKRVCIRDIDSDDDTETQHTSRRNRSEIFHEYCRVCCNGTAACVKPLRTPAYDVAQDDKSVISFLIASAGFQSREQVESVMIKAALEHEIRWECKKSKAVSTARKEERARQESLIQAGRQYYREKSEHAAYQKRMQQMSAAQIYVRAIERPYKLHKMN
jgi:hypothetical protein